MPHSVTGPRASPTRGAWLNTSCPTSFVMSARGTSLFTTCTNVIAKLHMPSLRYFAVMCLVMATSGTSVLTSCAYSMHYFDTCNYFNAGKLSMHALFPLHTKVSLHDTVIWVSIWDHEHLSCIIFSARCVIAHTFATRVALLSRVR